MLTHPIDPLDPDPICTIPPVIVSPLSFTELESIPEQIRLRNLPALWPISKAGQGIKVGIVDTGIDDDHSEFDNRIMRSVDFTGSRRGAHDVQGHGTHVASLVAGSKCGGAPKSLIYSYKALGDEGWGRSSWIARAILAAVEDGVHVINMSLGSSSASNEIYNALKVAYREGVICLAATGNDGRGRNGYPADFNDVCAAVGAIDFQGRLAQFSNTGSGTDLVDYGVRVPGAKTGGGFVQLSGTSMATPVAAGMVCNRLSYEEAYGINSDIPLTDRYKQLESLCDDMQSTGHDRLTGWGQINAKRAFGELPAPPPAPSPQPQPTPEPTPNPEPPAPAPPEDAVPWALIGRIWKTPAGHIRISNPGGEVLQLD